MMRNTTASMEVKNIQSHGNDLALVDVSMTINGMMGPDGKMMPAMPMHVFLVMKKEGGSWKYSNA